ncbi:gamma-glutamyltransferase family protein [Pseudooceanicola sp. CBS1P-1]|uniref:Gamma-glutamyltransferase n=1 Tax=Pseudooceanicola albus TaxID=2692189 RepID=A0A6L7GCA9_9RHOB|nr:MULTISPECIES: gamma-glutamyltransferase family protein [Pseudooceanicola]MBT9386682.1 gamma-glutamyltransferase family protein [Pseudooceanicola endophyticus]MXN20906.1 gamma-glutamyltransferase [Pseudooceanicola albus]
MRDFHLPGRSPVWAENGMVATSHPIAAQVALDMLKSGGNATDAALAGAIALGVCEPAMCGLAGDCFALIKPAGQDEVIGYNGSGRAPAGADAQTLRDRGITQIGLQSAEAVTLPGAVAAFAAMSGCWGRKGLDAVIAPAISYFEAGVPVHARAAFDWKRDQGALDPVGARHFLPGGKAPSVGDRFALPGQAALLRRIAAEGPRAFYEGEAAEDMLAALKRYGGCHTAEDFHAVAGERTTPVEGRYGDARLLEHPPNGQGATAILILNILAQFDLEALAPFGAARAHLEAEAVKLGYDARNHFLSDARQADPERMLDMDYARTLAARIDPRRAQPALTIPEGQPHRDTVYITVVDRDRMAVSLIYSVFHSFGSGIGTEKFGLLLHNRGCGFTLTPGHRNEYGAGKRPLHTIIPGMLASTGASPDLPFGVMGGAYQAAGHARFVTNLMTYGLTPQEAIDAPRSFPQDGRLTIERGYAPGVLDELEAMGHQIEIPEVPIGGAQAIRIHPHGMLEAGSDPRKDGCAVGY